MVLLSARARPLAQPLPPRGALQALAILDEAGEGISADGRQGTALCILGVPATLEPADLQLLPIVAPPFWNAQTGVNGELVERWVGDIDLITRSGGSTHKSGLLLPRTGAHFFGEDTGVNELDLLVGAVHPAAQHLDQHTATARHAALYRVMRQSAPFSICTTAGSPSRGAKPSRSGKRKPTATTITKPAKETSGITATTPIRRGGPRLFRRAAWARLVLRNVELEGIDPDVGEE